MLAFVSQFIAQINPVGNPVLAPNFQSFNSPFDYFNTILPTLITIGFVIGAVIFIFIFMIGAFQWITAGGDKGKLEDARHKITHAIVGLVILLLVYFIIQMVNMILGINIGMIGFPPVAPTPPPNRPELCDYSQISRTSLGPGESLTMTIYAKEPGAWGFYLAFYNEDNQNGPSGVDNPRPYCKQLDGSGNCVIYRSPVYYPSSPPEVSHTFTISYDDINDPDLNPNGWDGTSPRNIHVSGYFYDEAGNVSAPNNSCVKHVAIARIVQCVDVNPNCACPCGPGEIPDPSSGCNPLYPSCGNDNCLCIPYNFPPKLLLHYRLDEVSGVGVSDSSGNGYNTTLQDPTGDYWTNGVCNGALFSNGYTGTVCIAGVNINRSLFNAPSFTLAAWVYPVPEAQQQRYNLVIDNTNGPFLALDYRYLDINTFAIAAVMQDNTPLGFGGERADYIGPYGVNNWYHIAYTYSSGTRTLRIYKDGVMVKENTNFSPPTYPPPQSPLYYAGVGVGTNTFCNNFYHFNGKLDDARVYNYAMNNQEIKSLFDVCLPPMCGGLIIPTPGVSCYDTDGGRNYTQQGWVADIVLPNTCHQDTCANNDLNEVYCLNGLSAVDSIICLDGCNSGACLTNNWITPPPQPPTATPTPGCFPPGIPCILDTDCCSYLCRPGGTCN